MELNWFTFVLGLWLEIGVSIASVCVTNGPLGMITGAIKDWQIKASSTYPQEWDKFCHEKYARVYQPNKYGWCAKYKSSSEWLQVDLGVAAKITGVMTQGRGDGSEWVSSFMVSYSMDAFNWFYVTDQYGNQRLFEGNTDSYSIKHSYLDRPIIARFIKFHTVQWHRHPSMRVEILGCQLCKESIGLPPYGKLTASSHAKFKRRSSCQPDDGNILSNKAWCSRGQTKKEWIQLDIGPPTLVTGIVTKGRADTRRKHWVTRFKLSYSNDTIQWYYYKDASHLDPKNQWLWTTQYNSSSAFHQLIPDLQTEDGLEFGGNSDKYLERTHYLNSPFVARYIRFHPMEWRKKISMRVGLLGCPFTGECGRGFMRVNEDTPCVENLAFKKESWINSKRQFKRHIRNQDLHGPASRAVDGILDTRLHSCTTLDNLYGDNPVWMMDLGHKNKVSGVIIYTWQSEENNGEMRSKLNMNNLEKLIIYVHNKLKNNGDEQYASGNICGYVSRLNGAIFLPKVHVSCIRPLGGRYLSIEAWGNPDSWNKLFSAVFCEVQVYA